MRRGPTKSLLVLALALTTARRGVLALVFAPSPTRSTLSLSSSRRASSAFGCESSIKDCRSRKRRESVTRRRRRTLLGMSAHFTEADGKRVGIVGATGAVGKELLGCLAKRDFPIKELKLFGSKGGQTVNTDKWGDVNVVKFDVDELKDFDVVFLAASGDFAKKHAQEIADALSTNGIVIDNSSALRLLKDVPLVVPEVNGECVAKAKVIANPNCTTAIAIMVLYPLFAKFGLRKVIVSTYQAASGAGAAGMQELKTGVLEMMGSSKAKDSDYVMDDGTFAPGVEERFPHEVFAHPLPFNLVPHIDVFQDNLYTKEEMKVTWETKKLLGFDPFDDTSDDVPKVSCTAVRVPTLRAHAESIVVETRDPVTPESARQVLQDAAGVSVVDDPEHSAYPMPLTATGAYDVEVGRIRSNLVFGDHGLEFFVCGDQLLRGAALNAVLIAETAAQKTT